MEKKTKHPCFHAGDSLRAHTDDIFPLQPPPSSDDTYLFSHGSGIGSVVLQQSCSFYYNGDRHKQTPRTPCKDTHSHRISITRDDLIFAYARETKLIQRIRNLPKARSYRQQHMNKYCAGPNRMAASAVGET